MLRRVVRGGAPEYDQLATQLQKAFAELATAIKSGCSAPGWDLVGWSRARGLFYVRKDALESAGT
ncbi:hypothetical protein ACH4E7_34025 [Kitasatospora sp. NPDC018058]|uniref:hypothetical protein n=1 Tax=Kitasatospora sp. NPDC018058 TaxID=3364025 RepID=UPI0037BFDDEE